MNLWRWLGSGFGCRFGCSTAPLRLFVRCRSSSATVSGNGKLTKLKLEPQSQRERLRERPRANNNNQRREAFLREALFELCVLAAPFPPVLHTPQPPLSINFISGSRFSSLLGTCYSLDRNQALLSPSTICDGSENLHIHMYICLLPYQTCVNSPFVHMYICNE